MENAAERTARLTEEVAKAMLTTLGVDELDGLLGSINSAPEEIEEELEWIMSDWHLTLNEAGMIFSLALERAVELFMDS